MPPGLMPSLGAVAIEIATSDTNELPTGPLKIALTSHVAFVVFGTMPTVAVALDGKASLHAFDHEIDAKAMIGRVTDANLRADMEALIADDPENLALERGIKVLVGVLGWLTRRVEHVFQEMVPHALGAENIQTDGMKQPELVLGPTSGHIEALARGC
jgi:hypothetical protein